MKRHADAILILGGGVMQLPAITAAQRLGLVTHVADGNAECLGAAEADEFHHVDLRDLDGLLACAREIDRLRGVFTAGTDFSSSVAWITEHLGLPGIPYAVSRVATDKGRMRERLAAAGVNVPPYRIVKRPGVDDTALRNLCRALTFPVVCKPVDNMGARGVRQVASLDQLPGAVADSMELSTTGSVIVEELIEGQEYSLDALIIDDNVYVTGLAERHIYFPPWFVELGHTIPAPLPDHDRRALESTFMEAIRAIGITRGAAKGDIFLTHSRGSGTPVVTVGEIAARLSGGYMSGWTYPASSGVPLTEIAIEIAVGRSITPERLNPTGDRVCVERAVISAPGVIAGIVVPDRETGGLLSVNDHVFVTRSEGDTVFSPTNNVEKVANIIAVGNSIREAEERAALIRRHVTIALVPHNPVTDRFVFEEGWAGPWAHYRIAETKDIDFNRRPAIRGRRRDLEKIVSAGEPLPVQPLFSEDNSGIESIATEHLAVDEHDVLQRLVEKGVITFAGESSRADGLFWKAFLSSGLQGVDYLICCLTTPREVMA